MVDHLPQEMIEIEQFGPQSLVYYRSKMLHIDSPTLTKIVFLTQIFESMRSKTILPDTNKNLLSR